MATRNSRASALSEPRVSSFSPHLWEPKPEIVRKEHHNHEPIGYSDDSEISSDDYDRRDHHDDREREDMDIKAWVVGIGVLFASLCIVYAWLEANYEDPMLACRQTVVYQRAKCVREITIVMNHRIKQEIAAFAIVYLLIGFLSAFCNKRRREWSPISVAMILAFVILIAYYSQIITSFPMGGSHNSQDHSFLYWYIAGLVIVVIAGHFLWNDRHDDDNHRHHSRHNRRDRHDRHNHGDSRSHRDRDH